MIKAGLEHAMLTHDSAMLNSMVQQAATDLSAEKIRILDLNNMVRSSSWPSELGMHIDWDTPQCRACHQARTNATIKDQMVLHLDTNGTETLLIVSLIENQPECSSCHSPSLKTLGVLMTQVPLTDLDLQMQEGVRRVVLAALVTFGLLVGLMLPTLRGFITIPIDGSLPMDGIAPTLIQWADGHHPASRLNDLGCSLVRLEGFHPEAERIAAMLEAVGFDGKFNIFPLFCQMKSRSW